MNYCRRCGERLENTDDIFECKNGHKLYINPAPTVGIFLIDHLGKLVLAIRGVEPNKGCLDSIGGFVDAGETYEEALTREIHEETGLSETDYSVPVYLTSAPNLYHFDNENRSVLSVFYYATLNKGATPVANDDVAKIVYISPHEINIDDTGDAADVKIGLAKLLSIIS